MLSHRFNHNLLVLTIMVAQLLVIDRLKHIVPLLIGWLQSRPHFLKAYILVAHIDLIRSIFIFIKLFAFFYLIEP